MQLGSSTITFADQLVGVASTPAQTVTLTNNGTSVLKITTLAVSGANATDFNESDNCPKSPATVAVNGTCTISVTFTPAATGARAATIKITDDASGSPQSIALSGNGVAPDATLNSNALNFTGVVVNTTSATAQTVTLTNGGTAALTISTIVATGPFTQTNMGDMRWQPAGAIRLPQVGIDSTTRNSTKGQWRDELLRRFGHNHIEDRARLRQFAGEVDGFVGSDAAADAQDNVFLREYLHGPRRDTPVCRQSPP